MINRNTTVTTNLIVQKLWGFDSEAGENHVRVHLSFLRKKLALLNSDVWIKTIHGLGYMLVETKEG
jgi:DNA-binding response OmpR family regulator